MEELDFTLRNTITQLVNLFLEGPFKVDRRAAALDVYEVGVDPTDPTAPARIEARIVELTVERREQARLAVAAALGNPEIVEIIIAHQPKSSSEVIAELVSTGTNDG